MLQNLTAVKDYMQRIAATYWNKQLDKEVKFRIWAFCGK